MTRILLFLFLTPLALAARAQDNLQKSTLPETTVTPTVHIHVADQPEAAITAADLAKLPRHKLTAMEHGKAIEYEGVLLHDVLAPLGVPFGEALRGKALSTYVLATGRDGYAVVYTLTEMDTAFGDGDLLLADRSAGQPLTEKQGPLRIVAPHDKKPARSLRMLERIDVVQLRK